MRFVPFSGTAKPLAAATLNPVPWHALTSVVDTGRGAEGDEDHRQGDAEASGQRAALLLGERDLVLVHQAWRGWHVLQRWILRQRMQAEINMKGSSDIQVERYIAFIPQCFFRLFRFDTEKDD